MPVRRHATARQSHTQSTVPTGNERPTLSTRCHNSPQRQSPLRKVPHLGDDTTMKRLYLAMTAGIAVLFAIAYWKNTVSYAVKSAKWRAGKSAIDCCFVVLAALYLPPFLVGWCTMWLTRPLKRRGIQMSLAILLGVLFSTIGGIALEVLCVLAIFAVDLLTGEQGIYGWWRQRPPAQFMPYLAPEEE
jgi:hypothetical protein